MFPNQLNDITVFFFCIINICFMLLILLFKQPLSKQVIYEHCASNISSSFSSFLTGVDMLLYCETSLLVQHC